MYGNNPCHNSVRNLTLILGNGKEHRITTFKIVAEALLSLGVCFFNLRKTNPNRKEASAHNFTLSIISVI